MPYYSMTTPDFQLGMVLVHTAFHAAEHFEDLANELHKLGLAVEVPRLPSATVKADPGDGLARDTAAIEAAIYRLTYQCKDVIVHMHGYGGIPGSEAVAAVCEAQRALGPASRQGRIKKLIYLSSHTLLPGETLAEEYQRHPVSRPVEFLPHGEFLEHNLARYKTPLDTFYNTTPPEIAADAARKMTTMILSPLGTAPMYCGWRDYGIPTLYIVCMRDNANPRASQERMMARMQLLGADVKVRRLESDHSPYLGQSSQYISILQEECAALARVGETRHHTLF